MTCDHAQMRFNVMPNAAHPCPSHLAANLQVLDVGPRQGGQKLPAGAGVPHAPCAPRLPCGPGCVAATRFQHARLALEATGCLKAWPCCATWVAQCAPLPMPSADTAAGAAALLYAAIMV